MEHIREIVLGRIQDTTAISPPRIVKLPAWKDCGNV